MKDEYREKGSRTPAMDPQPPPPPPPPPMPSETSVFLRMYLDSAVCMDVKVYTCRFVCMHERVPQVMYMCTFVHVHVYTCTLHDRLYTCTCSYCIERGKTDYSIISHEVWVV